MSTSTVTSRTDELPDLARLVRAVEAAVLAPEFDTITATVEAALSAAVARGDELTPVGFDACAEDHYARRLLHQDPAGRFTVICMTWGPGQGTPLHDHGDSWGTVCVYRGKVRVTPYTLLAPPEGDRFRFRAEPPIDAGHGAATSVLPPDDHHIIANPFEETAMSVHVYRGTMESCGVFLPIGATGAYRREVKVLSFDGR